MCKKTANKTILKCTCNTRVNKVPEAGVKDAKKYNISEVIQVIISQKCE